ncbi:hypothetical protein PoB_003403800 [Plakobranchus ocellatus]|uniref:Uncharacterized protein n=1 Tax=Plakobranchus ocellatus TaxID=259542 RepID=A0AAV4AL61_9GAST|nr:hypothetical protein PoB_003403800 [Plakobranchus ocellatus]
MVEWNRNTVIQRCSLYRVRAPPSQPWSDGRPESMRSPCSARGYTQTPALVEEGRWGPTIQVVPTENL